MKLRTVFLLILVVLFMGLAWSFLNSQNQGIQAIAPTDARYSPLLTKAFATAYAFVTLTADRSADRPGQEVQVTKPAPGA